MALRYPLQQYVLMSSAVLTATGNGTAVTLPFTDFDSALVGLSISASSGTTPTLDMYLQTTTDGGTTWFDVYHWTQQTTTTTNPAFVSVSCTDALRAVGTVGSKTIGANALGVPLLSPTMRLAYTLTGTTPSFTTTVTLYVPSATHGL